MNIEYFIARRFTFDKESKKSIARSIINLAIAGISIGLAVLIISVCVVTGFKKEIRKKIAGFGSHIQILNYDSNLSYETIPVSKNQSFYPSIETIDGIKHIQVFGIKAGIIKTEEDIQGIILKGVGKDFDWSFFQENLIVGDILHITDSVKSNQILISKFIANTLKLKLDNEIIMYFIQEPIRMRKFKVCGIYETSLEELDAQFALVDIRHIQQLNSWKEDQISGFEILIDDFKDLDFRTYLVYQQAGLRFFDDGSKFKVVNIKEKYPQIFDWLNLLDMNVWVIITIMLLVAGFNMVSGLIILILDRIQTIGVLKAIGATNQMIKKVFLYQAAFLIMKGLFWGNIIGLGLCSIQSEYRLMKLQQSSYFIDYVPINFNLFYILLLNIGTLLVVLIMLLLPSLLITKLSPAKTIRFN